MTIDFTRVAADFRNLIGYLGIIFGVLTQAVPGMGLPKTTANVILAIGGVIVAIEHKQASTMDPNTANTLNIVTPPTPTPTGGKSA